MKLYRVRTTAKEFGGCRNVTFYWFRQAMPRGRRPYADLIRDYDPKDQLVAYAECLIEELFTEDEAGQLKCWIDRRHGHVGATVIEEEPLPVENRRMGFGAHAVGGGDGFYPLYEEP